MSWFKGLSYEEAKESLRTAYKLRQIGNDEFTNAEWIKITKEYRRRYSTHIKRDKRSK